MNRNKINIIIWVCVLVFSNVITFVIERNSARKEALKRSELLEEHKRIQENYKESENEREQLRILIDTINQELVTLRVDELELKNKISKLKQKLNFDEVAKLIDENNAVVFDGDTVSNTILCVDTRFYSIYRRKGVSTIDN